MYDKLLKVTHLSIQKWICRFKYDQPNLILHSEADTQALAEKLAQMNLLGSVWLSGDLGAGKTTLVRYWLQAMGHKGAVKAPLTRW